MVSQAPFLCCLDRLDALGMAFDVCVCWNVQGAYENAARLCFLVLHLDVALSFYALHSLFCM